MKGNYSVIQLFLLTGSIFPSTALVVSVSQEGTNTAGGMLSLNCTAFREAGSMGTIQVVWLGSDNQTLSNGSGITVGVPIRTNSTVTFVLLFSPLRVSHQGEYTCQASIQSSGRLIAVHSAFELTVAGESYIHN